MTKRIKYLNWQLIKDLTDTYFPACKIKNRADGELSGRFPPPLQPIISPIPDHLCMRGVQIRTGSSPAPPSALRTAWTRGKDTQAKIFK